jgi:hypothetical protein
MGKSVDTVLAEVTAELLAALRENLVSCCVYGSTVRGNAVPGVSDLNLLLVLGESSAAAHAALVPVLAAHPMVDPFVLARGNFERTARCFAAKFASIQRNYRVLHGADPFAGLRLDPQLERLLCEQAVRNLRLRFVYAFVTRRDRGDSYGRFLAANISSLFIHLAEVLRLNGQDVPKDFAERMPVLCRQWPAAAAVLPELAELREKPRALTENELPRWHERVLALLDAALGTIEAAWADPAPPRA